jgi:predicted nucleic acid-binding protein
MPATQNKVFLDATYLIALVSERDQFHPAAMQLMDALAANQIRIITTQTVLVEFANSLARPKFRLKAGRTIEDFQRDPSIEIIPLTGELFEKAFALFRERADKAWGLTDCISFVVMQERGISEALTADEHFEQAGFTALLNH